MSKKLVGAAARRTVGALPQLKASDRKSPLAVLRAARKLLSAPERWTQGFWARAANGYQCQWDAQEATCWCALGAVRLVSGGRYPDSHYDAAASALDASSDGEAGAYNDSPHRTHKQILALFDRAIKLAEKQHTPTGGK